MSPIKKSSMLLVGGQGFPPSRCRATADTRGKLVGVELVASVAVGDWGKDGEVEFVFWTGCRGFHRGNTPVDQYSEYEEQ
jgi:hypothetical protein